MTQLRVMTITAADMLLRQHDPKRILRYELDRLSEAGFDHSRPIRRRPELNGAMRYEQEIPENG